MRAIKLIFGLFATVSIWGCHSSADTVVKPGTWRATLTRDGQLLPVILNVSKNPDDKTYRL